MEGLSTIIQLLVFVLVIWNFINTLNRKSVLMSPSDSVSDKVHPKLRHEVELQIRDGYKLVSVEENSVKLTKKKRYLFSWWVLIFMPNGINIMFNSSLCNIYGVELSLFGNNIEVSTF